MPPLLTDKQIRGHDIDTLQRFVRYRVGGYRVAIKNVAIGYHVFRGVRWAARPDHVAQLSYCPPDTAPQGRANRKGEALFYACPAAAVVFYELRPKKGDLIALSEWE